MSGEAGCEGEGAREGGREEGEDLLLSSSPTFVIGAGDDVQTQLRASSLTLQDVHLSKRQNHLKSIKRTITMNKMTYANFHGVVNVFLVGGASAPPADRNQQNTPSRTRLPNDDINRLRSAYNAATGAKRILT